VTSWTVTLLAAATLLAGAGLSAAQAAEPVHNRVGNDFTNEAPWSAQAPRKQLQWDSKGRWGLRLDMNQPSNREADLKDLQAGAFFRITPSLQVGGSVGFGDRFAQPQRVTPQDATPRVHLETAFRF